MIRRRTALRDDAVKSPEAGELREQPRGMTDTQRRLTACFTAVFRTLADADVAGAMVGCVEGWDSLATVTLITVIEEEFQIQIDPRDIEHFASFEHALRYIEARSAGGAR